MPLCVRLDVRLLICDGDGVLLARPPGQSWNVLPGGPVEAGEGVEPALARHLGCLTGPTAGSWQFAGAAEHTGGTPTAGNEEAAHVLTLLFAAAWPTGATVPPTWGGCALHAVDIDLLIATRLAPLPVAWVARRWLAEEWPQWRGLASAAAHAAWRGPRPSVASLRAQLAAHRDQLRGRPFRDAAVAICALMTAADGRVDPAEREGLQAFAATDPVMANFPADELEQLFDAHLAALRADFDAGRRAALADIAKVRGRFAEAAAVMRIGEVIGRIDGAFPPVEQAVLRDAAGALGLDPAEFAVQAANSAGLGSRLEISPTLAFFFRPRLPPPV
jgi:tellurite resistance protein